jgi:hypothetical protein
MTVKFHYNIKKLPVIMDRIFYVFVFRVSLPNE